jgi:hypothetical protein
VTWKTTQGVLTSCRMADVGEERVGYDEIQITQSPNYQITQ